MTNIGLSVHAIISTVILLKFKAINLNRITSKMKITETASISNDDKKRLLEIWNQEYPANLKLKGIIDLDQFFMGLSDVNHTLLIDGYNIMGWYSDFKRDEERWFLMILDQSVHNQGYGRQLLNHAKTKHKILNGWVIDHHQDEKLNGSLYNSPLEFYLKHSFKVLPDIRLETEKISAVKIQWKR